MSKYTPAEHHTVRNLLQLLQDSGVFVNGDASIDESDDTCETLIDGTTDIAAIVRQLGVRSARLPADPPGRGNYVLIQVSGPPGTNGFITNGFYGGEGVWYVGNFAQLMSDRVQCWWPLPKLLNPEELASLRQPEERPIA